MEKSDLLNDQNESESTKAKGSLGSVTGGGGTSGFGSCESGFEEEQETIGQGKVGFVGLLSDESIQPLFFFNFNHFSVLVATRPEAESPVLIFFNAH